MPSGQLSEVSRVAGIAGGGFRRPSVAGEWLRGEGSLKVWRERISPVAFQSYYSFLYRYCLFVGMSPDQVLAFARMKKQEAKEEFEVLDALRVQPFVKGLGGRHLSKVQGYTAIRSFFMHNRVKLPVDPSFQIRSEIPPTERQLTLENLRELILMAPLWLRSMLLVKWMAIMDTEGLLYFSNNYGAAVTEALTRGDRIFKIVIPGRKKTKNLRRFYTFIALDALEGLRTYFERERGYPQNNEPIWYYWRKQGRGSKWRDGEKVTEEEWEHTSSKRKQGPIYVPVTKSGFTHAWTRLLRRAKLIPPLNGRGSKGQRWGYNVHNTRDVAISLLNTVDHLSPKCVEFWAGHTIDELGYNEFYKLKPDFVLEQYQLAEPYLNILSNQRTVDPQQNERIQALEAKIQALTKAFEAQQRQ